ncbi:MAG: glycosyltransferase family 2 protein [Gemmatimonadales bacterium]
MTHPTTHAEKGDAQVATGRPVVSVVVPFWNTKAFIEEAIHSVLAQTFHSWEMILVDDGSSDGSTEIAQRYTDRFPGRIRYVEHEGHRNRGVAASRNLGVRQAQGKYVAFLDADDVWFPNKLERQAAILDSESDAAMVCGPSQSWYSWTGRPQDVARDYVKDLRIARAGLVKPPALLISSLTRGTFVANPSTILIRREALARVGGFEESFVGRVQTCEDSAFLAKVQLRESVFVATECWSRYRKHENSLFSIMTRTGRTRETRLFYLTWLERYLAQQQVDSDEIWDALRRALWPYCHPVRHALGNALKRVARHTIPSPIRRWLRAQWERHRHSAPPEPTD